MKENIDVLEISVGRDDDDIIHREIRVHGFPFVCVLWRGVGVGNF